MEGRQKAAEIELFRQMAPSPRFLLVGSALGLCAVVALFALAADQYSAITAGDELVSKDTVSALKAMLQKQASMDKEEAGLFAALTTKKKAVVHHQAAVKRAAVKKVNHVSQKDDEVAKLKAELAAAEAKDKKDSKQVPIFVEFGLADRTPCAQAT